VMLVGPARCLAVEVEIETCLSPACNPPRGGRSPKRYPVRSGDLEQTTSARLEQIPYAWMKCDAVPS
jgi:hypothetical protein